MSFLRLPLAAAAATVVTFSMFGVMNALTNVRTESGESVAVAKIEFVRLRQEVEVEEKKREKVERVKPEQAPVVPTISVAKEEGVNLELDVQAIAAGLGAEFGSAGGGGGDGRGVPGGLGLGGGMSDRGALPLVRVEPQYPPQAAKRGLEGWVQLRFTITTAGTVSDVAVVKSSNPVFERAAMEAVHKGKYEPQMQSGTAVATAGVDVVLRFNMES
jgi:periplasmic protein TonB